MSQSENKKNSNITMSSGKARNIEAAILKGLVLLATVVTFAVLLFLIVYILVNGIPKLDARAVCADL